jgi:predicted RNA methylase
LPCIFLTQRYIFGNMSFNFLFQKTFSINKKARKSFKLEFLTTRYKKMTPCSKEKINENRILTKIKFKKKEPDVYVILPLPESMPEMNAITGTIKYKKIIFLRYSYALFLNSC